MLEDEWQQSPGLMVSMHNGMHVGYVRIVEVFESQSAILKDLVVDQSIRRQGIGTALVLAAQNWAVQRANRRLMLEIPPKSYPAIKLAFKLGFDFSGYHDAYYPNKDIALFFSKYLK
jgi:ribosomal protein S18 acetylase RimI-like enzyme